MSVETPNNNSEEIRNLEEAEGVAEMSKENFELMVSEISAYKEILQQEEIRLADLEKNPGASIEEIETLKTDIEGLRYQISEREELL